MASQQSQLIQVEEAKQLIWGVGQVAGLLHTSFPLEPEERNVKKKKTTVQVSGIQAFSVAVTTRTKGDNLGCQTALWRYNAAFHTKAVSRILLTHTSQRFRLQ